MGDVSGNDVGCVRRELMRQEDWHYAGQEGDWLRLLNVIREKFAQGSSYAAALLRTGSAFLLEHSSKVGDDLHRNWPDNYFCEDGLNWIGMQLMIIRDELQGEYAWTPFLEYGCTVNLTTGRHDTELGRNRWHEAVLEATRAVSSKLSVSAVPPARALEQPLFRSAQAYAPLCKRIGCGKP